MLIVALAHRLAEAAGERIRTYFRRSFDIEHKQDTSLVTIADRETEQAMRRILAVEAPEDCASLDLACVADRDAPTTSTETQ